MASEITINRLENVLNEVVDFSGTKEQTTIISNMEVVNAAPTGLSGFVTIRDDRDGDTILATKVPGVIYQNSDLVNVLFIDGTEPIAFQQASASGGDPVAVSKLVSPDLLIDPVISADNSGDVTLAGTGDLILPDDIIHSGDTDTLISLEDDKIVLQAGGAALLTVIEAATDGVGINEPAPDGLLHVTGNDADPLFFLENDGDTTAARQTTVNFQHSNAVGAKVAFTRKSGNANGANIQWLTETTGGSLTERMRLDEEGQLGIGVNNPTVILSIADTTSPFIVKETSLSSTITTNTHFRHETDQASISDGFGVINLFSLQDTGGSANVGRFGFIRDGADNEGAFIVRCRTDGNEEVMRISSAGLAGIGTSGAAAQLHVDQASTTAAVPVLYLDQADISEEMIEFNTTIGVGNAIEAVGAKVLTTTHFIKVTLPGALTRYIPAGTIA